MTSAQPVPIGVDVGRALTKVSFNGATLVFPTVLMEVSPEEGDSYAESSATDGRWWVWGDDFYHQFTSSYSLPQHKFLPETVPAMALLGSLASIKQAQLAQPPPLHLVLGLSSNFIRHARRKKNLQDFLQGSHILVPRPGEDNIELTVARVSFLPQGMGIYAKRVLTTEGKVAGPDTPGKNWGIVDVGAEHIRFLYISEGKVNQGFSETVENLGIRPLLRRKKLELEENFGEEISLQYLERCLLDGRGVLWVSGTTISLDQQIQSFLFTLRESILNKLFELWGAVQPEVVVLGGGGAVFLEKNLSGWGWTLFTDTDLTSNAEGFRRWGRFLGNETPG